MWFEKLLPKKIQTISQLPVEHDWALISRSYSAPRKDAAALAALNLPTDVLQKALTGVTTYLWQCKNTGELRKEELLGTDKDELEELVEKVDRGGMQYIRLNGNVYAIAKWAPPQDGSEPRVPLK
jgi:hypothetical protein